METDSLMKADPLMETDSLVETETLMEADSAQAHDDADVATDANTSHPKRHTLEEAMGQIGMGWFGVRTSLICGLVYMLQLGHLDLIRVLIGELRCEWEFVTRQGILLQGVGMIGLCLGSAFFGTISDKFGRRPALCIALYSLAYYTLLATQSQNYYMMLVLLGLAGFSLGGVYQAYPYLTEFVPTNRRGLALDIMSVSWALGALTMLGLCILALTFTGWRGYLLVVAIVDGVVAVIVTRYAWESPHYLLVSGQTEKLNSLLSRMAASRKTSVNICDLVLKDIPISDQNESQHLGDATSSQAHTTVVVTRGRLLDFFTPGYRSMLLVWVFVSSLMNFAYTGFSLVAPYVYGGLTFCGSDLDWIAWYTTAEMVYEDPCPLVCEHRSPTDFEPAVFRVLAEWPGILIVTAFTMQLGHRGSLVGFCSVVFLAATLMLVCYSPALTQVSVTVAQGAAAGIIWIVQAFVSELYPTCSRGSAIGWVTAISILAGILTSLLVATELEQYGSNSSQLSVAMFALASLACVFTLLGFRAETIRRPLASTFKEPPPYEN